MPKVCANDQIYLPGALVYKTQFEQMFRAAQRCLYKCRALFGRGFVLKIIWRRIFKIDWRDPAVGWGSVE